jgi:hypothetical protein
MNNIIIDDGGLFVTTFDIIWQKWSADDHETFLYYRTDDGPVLLKNLCSRYYSMRLFGCTEVHSVTTMLDVHRWCKGF